MEGFIKSDHKYSSNLHTFCSCFGHRCQIISGYDLFLEHTHVPAHTHAHTHTQIHDKFMLQFLPWKFTESFEDPSNEEWLDELDGTVSVSTSSCG